MIVDGSQGTGVSAVRLLGNICYAGMRAQAIRAAWKVLSFLFGFRNAGLLARGEGRKQSRVRPQSAGSSSSVDDRESK
jgi:hypothetical protein